MTLPSFRVTIQWEETGYGKEIPAVTLPWLLIISVLSSRGPFQPPILKKTIGHSKLKDFNRLVLYGHKNKLRHFFDVLYLEINGISSDFIKHQLSQIINVMNEVNSVTPLFVMSIAMEQRVNTNNHHRATLFTWHLVMNFFKKATFFQFPKGSHIWWFWV